MADSQLLTLAQYALQSQDPRYISIVKSLYDSGSIMARDIPFISKKTLTVNGQRYVGEGPAINWVKLNDTNLTGEHTTPERFQEQAYLSRQSIYTDDELLTDENALTNPHNFSVDRYFESFAFDFNDKFFNNNHGKNGNTECFVGIRERLDNADKYGAVSTNKMSGNACDLTASGATSTTLGNFFELLDELLWRLNSSEGDGVVLYIPAAAKRRVDNLARRYSGQGGFSVATDQVGRSVSFYKGAQIRVPGLKIDQATEILTTTETTAGADGSSDYFSVYGVRYTNGGLMGWTKTPLSAVPDNSKKPTHTGTLIQWSGGLMVPDPKAIGRIYNLKYK